MDVLKNYVGFPDRAQPAEYRKFTLVNTVIGVVLTVVDQAIGLPVLYVTYSLAVLVPSLAVLVRRLHDTGRSAWWL